jgi:F0F1-type ATP synthase membrane subunit c/vacuolar-type H+-ATPase subunit K
MVGGAACRGVADVPEHGQKINNTFFVGAGVSQSTSIYAFVISLLLMAYTV